MKFKFFEHTADTKFQAYGETLDEAFSNACLALTNVMYDKNVAPKIEKQVSVSGLDHKALLYSLLEEVLFLLDSEGFLVGEVKSLKIKKKGTAYELSCRLLGDKAGKYETSGDVKAVTYNEMEILAEPKKAMVQVVLDI